MNAIRTNAAKRLLNNPSLTIFKVDESNIADETKPRPRAIPKGKMNHNKKNENKPFEVIFGTPELVVLEKEIKDIATKKERREEK